MVNDEIIKAKYVSMSSFGELVKDENKDKAR